MRYIAAIPAVGLLCGAAVGVFLPELPRFLLFAALIAGAATAIAAWSAGRSGVLAASVIAAFFAGGTLLAADAWARAWSPPLWTAFQLRARTQRARAEAEGRRLPEDDEASVTVEGVLRADAARSESGVSLSIDVDRVEREAGQEGQEGEDGRERQEGQEGREGQGEQGARATALAERTAGGITVTVVGSLAADRMGEWRAGRRVRLPVMLRRASRYLDPGVPDHERELARRGTRLVGTAKSGALVDVLAPGGWFDELMSASRGSARRAIAAGVGRWSARSGAIVAAIVIGDRAGLDEELQRQLQEAGTYHVIAISGGNIAILAGLLIGGFRFAGWLGRTAMLSSIAALLVYAALVGNGASVDRATLMAVVYFGARAADQRSRPLNALALVAAILVAADPLSVTDPAFLLTFGATLAILVVVPAITTFNAEPAEPAEKHLGSAVSASSALIAVLRRHLWPMFAASLAAEALLFPVGAWIFSRITFAGLALNFLAIPLMGVAQIAGMAVVPLSFVSATATAAAGWVAHVGAAGLVWSAELVRFAPMVTYRIAPPSWIAMALYYAAASVCGICRWRGLVSSRVRRVQRAIAPLAAVVAAGAAFWILADPRTLLASRGDGALHVTFLDVGQGDAALVVFPRGSTLLVDTGGLSSSAAFDIGDRVVAPVLRHLGLRRIAVLALSHGDPDHIGGAAAILREFRPREVWEGIPVPRSDALNRLRVAAQSGAARWANVYRGDRIAIDGVDVIARHPGRADWERQKVRNDDSLVLELRWRDVSFVLTGDIGKAVEAGVAAAIAPARLRIVKIPHHGSLTSSSAAFLAALHPQVAVASVGRANHFGHPAPEVLDRYRAIGAAVFRTDQDGAVTMSTDGSAIDIHTFAGRALSISAGTTKAQRHEDARRR